MIDFKFWRIKRNLTRSQLASKVRISENYIYEIETGRKIPSLKTIYRIADALDVELILIDKDDNNLNE